MSANIVPNQKATSFEGHFDRFEDGMAYGWVINKNTPLDPVVIHAIIDGQETEQVLANEQRDDIRAALIHPTGRVGFSYCVPKVYLDGREHRISFRLPRGIILDYLDPDVPGQTQSELVFTAKYTPKIRGHVDGLRQGQIHGWVTRTEIGDAEELGGCHVLVTCDGARVAQLRADRYRGDVAAAMGCAPNCGFQLTVPRAFRSSNPRMFRFEVMPEGIEIDGSPLFTRTIDDQLEAALVDVSEQMETMFRDFVKLRRRITEMLPQPGYNLDDYDRWARAYYPALRSRIEVERATCNRAGVILPDPLVSILVPAYRPLISDFVAAIESVIAQTYQNWELVIVDDCSRDPDLTAKIKSFCERDKRIRSIIRKKNGNISEATNTAIEAAQGEYIAFFDHDDLLVDVAIEVMVREARRTGAHVLYSDEDKIDQSGYFLEPNFKPDWNYRYLLGSNYICHLLFVACASLAKAGPLNTKYNGAQDHDLILRLSEVVPANRIHHVQEVLYHWRKTPNSTATDISRKNYAVEAGIRAVSDHLARKNLQAKVESVKELPLYNPIWKNKDEPKVCIIIPFKDEVEITRKCLETVLSGTDYVNFEIILVDNWSLTAEAAEFVIEVERKKKIKVLRVEEPFNFSRLNRAYPVDSDTH